LQTTALGRWLLIPYRFKIAASYHAKPLLRVFPWLLRSREPTDFNYELTDLNLGYMAEFLNLVTGVPSVDIGRYIDELADDEQLWAHIRDTTLRTPERHISDADPKPGRRLAWYALVRAVKPRVIVEGGVNKGLGTCILAAALARNAAEGRSGRVYGVDNVAGKGYLFGPPYDAYGEIVITDILDFLRGWTGEIDVFIQDAVTLPAIEREAYRLVAPKLAPDALVCASWRTGEFLGFARETARSCLSFATQPKDHWYPGENVATAFTLRPSTVRP